MDTGSTYFGVLVWGIITILNMIVFSIVSHPRNWAQEKPHKMIYSAVITTIIIHVIALFDSPAEVFMWMLISFPFVGGISFMILLMLKSFAEYICKYKNK
ncbi:MAG: hypothetical protein JXR69_05840 [Candidatus Delongbacteria bacterium]|nr:hypothetical protein [Candidatus Delongbacteria bacterium]